jgi:DNA invertase Pin-like site-specific DNA recombinase
MSVIGYLRDSNLGDSDDGLRLPTQERLIRAWARMHGHHLTAMVSDDAGSEERPDTERPGLLDALSAVKRGAAAGIVVTDFTRLARTMTVQEAILAQVWARGGRMFTVEVGEVLVDDPEDPMRTAMRRMAGVFSELDRALVIQRLRNGRATKAANGGHAVGRAPFGWQAENGKLVIDEAEQATIRLMVAWSGDGVSLAEIARRLTADGVVAKGGRKWYPSTVSRAIERASRTLASA